IEPFVEAFSEEQKIGSFTYTYQSILVFFFVIIASVFISKIVSFLASENKAVNVTEEKKSSTGSWILLVRIAIISIGITFAFAIAGIPTDRLTVIIGALGVGIGFGLQALVNNLISGLIIAFEKPVNIDDIIEIGGQTGTMKSIGIRSSVVTTWDGADIIIPNGDILSQHMTNWTMGSAKRRYEIKVGVAYGTNLKLAKSIIQEVLDHHSLILKNPEPLIWVTQFGDSSIDFVIKYWVPHFNYGNEVKSDLIMAIDEIFKLNNIVIPFPQQDIYIKSNGEMPKEIKE
ncbi:MAG TPA: mechanosensitive ion channel, partial [Flavobacterium sp.]|nr:mechanosensitive ion channel [Flavobacterium sp.]